jgi:hypothetical protein
MTEPASPNPPPHDARARRRRARRALFPSDAEGQAAVLADLAHRSYPSFELFVFAVVSGVILAIGYAIDSQAMLIFGALAAPLLTPWVGLAIAIVTGSPRYFLQTFAALLVSAIIVFLIGLAAGFAALPFEPHTHQEVHLRASLWIPQLAILALGAILLVITFVRTENKPYIPSAFLAYAIYLPISAAGFGLGARLDGVFPEAALVALVHFAFATAIATFTLIFLRFRPRSFGGFLFTFVIILTLIAAAWTAYAFDFAPNGTLPPPAPAPTLRSLPTSTLTASPSEAPSASPSATLPPSTPTETLTPTPAPATSTSADASTLAFTLEPTPIFASIKSPEGGGARVRATPGGDYLFTLNNGYIVIVVGETVDLNGVIWVKILVDRNGEKSEGWIIQSLLATATPVVNWQPTETLTP